MMRLTPFKDKLADIAIAMGQVLFASAFIDPLVREVYDWTLIIPGFTFAVISWSLGLLLVRKRNYE